MATCPCCLRSEICNACCVFTAAGCPWCQLLLHANRPPADLFESLAATHYNGYVMHCMRRGTRHNNSSTQTHPEKPANPQNLGRFPLQTPGAQ
jgi:hypothetical protein